MKSAPLSDVLSSSATGYWGTDPGLSEADVAAIRNGDIKANGIRWDTLPVRGFDSRQVAKSAVRAGDILLTTSGEPGKVAMAIDEPSRITCATNFVRLLRFDPRQIDGRYGYHFLTTKSFRDSIAPFVRGTTMKNLSTRDAFPRVRIQIPPLVEQRRIAAILDHADALRARRRQVLSHLDSLTQSIFYEMFSDIAAERTVEQVAEPVKGSIRTGPFGSQLLHSEFVDDGIAVLGLDNVVANEFRWVERRFITDEKYKQLSRYTVHPGDVLISIMGTTGRCVVVPSDIPPAINTKHICAITLDRSHVLPDFVRAAFLWHPESRRHLRQRTKGSVMDGLNMGIIRSMPLPVPPLNLQLEFEARVARVASRRRAASNALTHTDELFASLQARAFGGQL